MFQIIFRTTILFALMLGQSVWAQKKIFVFTIQSEIDPVSQHFVETAVKEANNQDADILILELDTYGGALDAADKIRTQLLSISQPVYVYINKNAASAGALISLACDSIYMSKGANIGAATVVNESGQPLPEKYQSYMRSLMRSTAEANNRDADKAQQMVGVLTSKDSTSISKVLSYTTSEAIKNGFCEAEINTIELLFDKIAPAKDRQIIRYELSATEKIISFFLNPYLRGVLILIIIAGIYYEMSSPGIGFALLASGIATLLYFVPSYLTGLTENWEILLFLVGVVLLMLEIFVIPGFGLAGIIGIAAVIASLVLAMVNNHYFDFSFVKTGSLIEAVSIALFATLLSGVALFILGDRLFKRIALQETLSSAEGYNANFLSNDLKGKKGIAHTILRPSGKVSIENEIYDAYSTGEFIEKGTEIEVIDHLGTQLKVKKQSAV